MTPRMILCQLAVAVFVTVQVDIPLITSPGHAENIENSSHPAEADRLNALFDSLQQPGEGWRLAEAEILQRWSQSGSAAMDLLLRRGTAALDTGEAQAAIGHLTALVDHAPDFAEGHAARAAAYASVGLYGPAIADIARTLELEPRQFAALTLLCRLLVEMDDLSRAAAACRASLAIHPHQQEAIDLLAQMQHMQEGVWM